MFCVIAAAKMAALPVLDQEVSKGREGKLKPRQSFKHLSALPDSNPVFYRCPIIKRF